MPQRAYVRTSKPALRATLVVLSVFFIGGIVVLVILAREGAGIGVGFFAFWLLIVAIGAGIVIHNLRTYDKNPAAQIVEEIIIPDSPPARAAEEREADFEAKLRRLESLRKDGLISEAEYAAKRAEIMGRMW
jgi:hypothetical protein